MRSRKVEPGSAVTRTTSQSESTLVPPVTALRSPPDSRITGALSPVITLSSTEATPSITSPSHGITSFASTSTVSPLCRRLDTTGIQPAPRRGSERSLAKSSRRERRRDSACALPRPSAIASAKFANRTVNHNQTETARMKPAGASPWPSRASIKSTVVSTLPTSVTSITGLRTWWRGSSFRNDSMIAPRTMAGSKSAEV
jgi:hypothetical protein